MAPFRSRLEDLPEIFPVFPLTGALLLPGGRLPLNIFEPRYLAMTEDALAEGRMFGMIQPGPRQVAGAAEPTLYTVGCLGRLTSFSETEDGRYLITLLGVIRFTVVEEVEGRRGYRRVRGVFSRFTADLDTDADTAPVDRDELLDALRAYFRRRGFDANWDAIDEMPDEALVVTLCMVCPFEPASKQALLEAVTPADRAQALLALLRIESHGGRRGDEDQPEGRPRAS